MSRRALALAAAVLAAAVAWLALHRMLARPPSDEEQIRSLFADAARAAEAKRASDVVEAVSERFRSEDGLDKRELRQLVLAQVLRGEWVSVTIAGARVEVEGGRAQAVLDVVMARSGKGRALADLLPAEAEASRIACRLEREEGRWRVVSASRRAITLDEAVTGPPR